MADFDLIDLSKEAHIVDGIIASTLFQIRTDKLENLKRTKDILNKRYYPEDKVQDFITQLKALAFSDEGLEMGFIKLINKLSGSAFTGGKS